MDSKFYLVSVYGDTRQGTRNGCCEDFNTRLEAEEGIIALLTHHPDATWKLIYGEEIKRG